MENAMKKLLLLTVLSFSVIACDQFDQKKTQEPDNTGVNVRDRDMETTTPFDQSESKEDRTVTQKIRQAIMKDDSLSTDAKNIKIITINGVVTLRGPVASSQEKDTIARKVNGVSGVSRVDNQLEVAQ
jgi:hyperosmotically inducible periplasmic protein